MIKKPRGTEDILPQDSTLWRAIEKTAHDVCSRYGYKEIRTPVFEDTSLFNRGVGETTDVVQKEMYTFNDKGDRSITLRPEGTASVARSYIENSLYANPQPTKLYYMIPCYRYEKPQSGRLREFHQFGLECFGSDNSSTDAEIIALALDFFDNLGIKDLKLNLNSIGCPECKPSYNKALKEYFMAHNDELCETCKDRLEKNPMRILDCKSKVCSKIGESAPKMLDYLCDDCNNDFSQLTNYLDKMNISYLVDTSIVRGLDYYTRTVFEITSDALGAQSTVCGGGRYNGLVEELGGKSTPGIGFAMGIERLILILKNQNLVISKEPVPDIFIGTIGDGADVFAQVLVHNLRNQGLWAERDLCLRSVKAQMKYANKLGAKYSLILGDDEISTNNGTIKNMENGEQTNIELSAQSIYELIKKENE